MKCLVVLLLLVYAGTTRAAVANSCAVSEEHFARLNVSADDGDITGAVCGGPCCSRGRESSLRTSLRRRVGARAADATRPIADLLLSTRRTLQEHLTGLSRESENETALFFTQMYKGHASRTHAPLSALYEDIRSKLRPSEIGGEDFRSPSLDLAASVRKFFRDVFPVVFHNVLKLTSDMKQFTPEYEVCLRDAYDAAKPFGDVPRQFGADLSRSLEAARALLQALTMGAGTLAASERILASAHDESCSTALLRAGGCAYCRGQDARPCQYYCLNVVRGCFGSVVAELDAPWAGYVEGVERLARTNDADRTLRELATRVSKAVMYAMESETVLEKKVRQECGPPSTVEAAPPPPRAPSREVQRVPPADTELLEFAAALAASKKLFARVADRICDEPDFAHSSNDRCWNGQSVGEYSKPLAASTSISDQRYNPEVTGGALQNSEVAGMADQLRQARQLLSRHSAAGVPGDSAPTAEAVMLGDEAGDEGSGSGRSYDDDAQYDAEGSGEGSGDHMPGPRLEEETRILEEPKTDSATAARPLSLAIALTLLAVLSQSFT